MTPNEKERILTEHKTRLSDHEYGADDYDDMIHIASVITSVCQKLEVEIPVIVGGLAVETYTSGGYSTCDIDFITNSESDIRMIMESLGFKRRLGYRYWSHPLFGGIVEFPTPPLDGSRDKITIVQFDNDEECYFQGVEDVIIGRLEEFLYWDKKNLESQSSVQLRLLLHAQRENIDFDYLQDQAAQRGLLDALNLILSNID